MSTLYILYSLKDKRTYVGSTNDLEHRLKKHNSGRVRSTKNRRPLKLIYREEFNILANARKRERFFKSSAGRRKMKELFKN